MLLRPHFLRKRLRQKSWKRMHQSSHRAGISESIHTEPAYEGHHPVEESIPYDAAEKPEEPHVRAEK